MSSSYLYRQSKSIYGLFTKGIKPITTLNRNINISPKYLNNDKGPKPLIYYVQNPFIWLMNKLDFFMLQHTWDPEINEKDFLYGAKKALCRISELISEDKLDDLIGLMNAEAVESVKFDTAVATRKDLKITEDDVQKVLLRKIYFYKISSSKFCDIDTVLIAVKKEDHPRKRLLYIELTARFQRKYDENVKPEWTVTMLIIPRIREITNEFNN